MEKQYNTKRKKVCGSKFLIRVALILFLVCNAILFGDKVYIIGSATPYTLTESGTTWSHNSDLLLGNTAAEEGLDYPGKGWLEIPGNSQLVTTGDAKIGNVANSVGVATLSDSNASWSVSGEMSVGNQGDGTLLVSNGASVTSSDIYMAVQSGSSGVLNVTGIGSTVTSSGDVYVGGDALGAKGVASLNASYGGELLADNVTVWDSGSLAGNGLLTLDSGSGSLTVYGKTAPGNSIGTLNVDGDVSFESGSEFEVEIDNAGNSDKLVATGDITINGGNVVAKPMETLTGGSHNYTFLRGNSVSGTFDTLDTRFFSSIALFGGGSLDYDPTEAHLNITILPFNSSLVCDTSLRLEVGSALEQIANSGGNAITSELQGLNLAQLHSSYDALGGENLPAIQESMINLSSMFMGMARMRMRGVSDSLARHSSGNMLLADAGKLLDDDSTVDVDVKQPLFAIGNGTKFYSDKGWGFWGRAFGLSGDRESGSNLSGYNYDTVGSSFGLDRKISEQLLVGMMFGYSKTDIDISSSRDHTDVDSLHFGLYSSYDAVDWYLDTSLAYSTNQYDGKRYIDVGTIREVADAEYDGQQFGAAIQLGLRYRLNNTLIEPLAGFDLVHDHEDGYSEKGAPNSNLHVKSSSFDSYKSSLGARFTKMLHKESYGCDIRLEVLGKWIHEFGDTRAETTSYFPGFSSGFTAKGDDIDRDSALIGLGMKAFVTDRTDLFCNYKTIINRDSGSFLISGGFQYRW